MCLVNVKHLLQWLASILSFPSDAWWPPCETKEVMSLRPDIKRWAGDSSGRPALSFLGRIWKDGMCLSDVLPLQGCVDPQCLLGIASLTPDRACGAPLCLPEAPLLILKSTSPCDPAGGK